MKRENISLASAVVMQLSGIALAFLSFYRSPDGEIADSVLWYVAQTLLYSGSIYGVTVYVQTKFAEIRSQLFGGDSEDVRPSGDTRTHVSPPHHATEPNQDRDAFNYRDYNSLLRDR